MNDYEFFWDGWALRRETVGYISGLIRIMDPRSWTQGIYDNFLILQNCKIRHFLNFPVNLHIGFWPMVVFIYVYFCASVEECAVISLLVLIFY